MGYEVKYIFHPRKEDGSGYDTEVRQDKSVKVGKPFDDTPLEKCAAAILAQLARRDVWVVDVEVSELVKKPISFKESADGKGIVLKNKRFSFNAAAEMVTEETMPQVPMQYMPVPAPVMAAPVVPQQPHELIPQGVQPHELMRPQAASTAIDNLYANPNATSVRRSVDPRSIDRSKILYHVYFEPYMHQAQAKALKLRFTEDTRYPVHAVIPSPTGKLDAQQIAITDDTGQVVIIDEKFFTSAGRGLMGDKELNFSGDKKQGMKKPKLSFERELNGQQFVPPGLPEELQGIPLDDGTIPSNMMEVPEIRRN
jgi:hypothetical protein